MIVQVVIKETLYGNVKVGVIGMTTPTTWELNNLIGVANIHQTIICVGDGIISI